MKRVVGIGGLFIKSKNPDALRAWYRDHLGFDVNPWGGVVFTPSTELGPLESQKTAWSLFAEDSTYFAPSTQSFMINYRVDDLHALLAQLKEEGEFAILAFTDGKKERIRLEDVEIHPTLRATFISRDTVQ